MGISMSEYRQLMKNLGKDINVPDKKSKYHSNKVWVYGIAFDSQKEADYYCQLKLLLRGGVIDGFCRQARFVITAGDDGTKAVEYVTDFVIFFPDKTYKIVDVKGMETPVFKLKMKSLKEKYPKINIELEK